MMEDIFEELKSDIEHLEDGILTLSHSYSICSKIGLKKSYKIEELDAFEAFTSRFSRLSDIITQKVFSSILIIEKGFAGSIIDKANYAEKISVIETSTQFRELRNLRNFIAHEYTRQNTTEVFEKVLKNTPKLITIIEKTISYCKIEYLNKLT